MVRHYPHNTTHVLDLSRVDRFDRPSTQSTRTRATNFNLIIFHINYLTGNITIYRLYIYWTPPIDMCQIGRRGHTQEAARRNILRSVVEYMINRHGQLMFVHVRERCELLHISDR